MFLESIFNAFRDRPWDQKNITFHFDNLLIYLICNLALDIKLCNLNFYWSFLSNFFLFFFHKIDFIMNFVFFFLYKNNINYNSKLLLFFFFAEKKLKFIILKYIFHKTEIVKVTMKEDYYNKSKFHVLICILFPWIRILIISGKDLVFLIRYDFKSFLDYFSFSLIKIKKKKLNPHFCL